MCGFKKIDFSLLHNRCWRLGSWRACLSVTQDANVGQMCDKLRLCVHTLRGRTLDNEAHRGRNRPVSAMREIMDSMELVLMWVIQTFCQFSSEDCKLALTALHPVSVAAVRPTATRWSHIHTLCFRDAMTLQL